MMLGDRIVCGIRDEEIQRQRLVEKDLTFQKAYEIVTSMEITSQNMAILQESKESETVNKVTVQVEGADGQRMPYKRFVLGAEKITVHKLAGSRNWTVTFANKKIRLRIDVQIATEVSRGVRSKASSRTEEIRRDILVSRGLVTYTS